MASALREFRKERKRFETRLRTEHAGAGHFATSELLSTDRSRDACDTGGRRSSPFRSCRMAAAVFTADRAPSALSAHLHVEQEGPLAVTANRGRMLENVAADKLFAADFPSAHGHDLQAG